MASRRGDKERLRAERLEAERRRRLTLVGAAIVGVVVVGAIIVVVLRSGSGGDKNAQTPTTGASVATTQVPGAQTTAPPWTNGAADSLQQRLRALGLAVLSAEGTALHIHEHLDVFVAGKATSVPAGIGIDPAQQLISPLHTHDPTGVLHVQSPTQRTFTLRQFFGVWGVPLTRTQLGALRAGSGKLLRAYVNGKPFTGDPASSELAPHQELVIAYGTATQMPNPVPSRYNFPSGL